MSGPEWRQPGGPFEVRVTPFPGTSFIQLIGELDFAAADCVARFTDEFLASECVTTDVVLDLTELSLADARGVRSVSDTCDRLRQEGFTVAVCGVRPMVRVVLDVTGVTVPPVCSRPRQVGPGAGSSRPRVYRLVDGRVHGPPRDA
jgi:anti-anti-sigma factor